MVPVQTHTSLNPISASLSVRQMRICWQQLPWTHLSVDGGTTDPAGREQNRRHRSEGMTMTGWDETIVGNRDILSSIGTWQNVLKMFSSFFSPFVFPGFTRWCKSDLQQVYIICLCRIVVGQGRRDWLNYVAYSLLCCSMCVFLKQCNSLTKSRSLLESFPNILIIESDHSPGLRWSHSQLSLVTK